MDSVEAVRRVQWVGSQLRLRRRGGGGRRLREGPRWLGVPCPKRVQTGMDSGAERYTVVESRILSKALKSLNLQSF